MNNKRYDFKILKPNQIQIITINDIVMIITVIIIFTIIEVQHL